MNMLGFERKIIKIAFSIITIFLLPLFFHFEVYFQLVKVVVVGVLVVSSGLAVNAGCVSCYFALVWRVYLQWFGHFLH